MTTCGSLQMLRRARKLAYLGHRFTSEGGIQRSMQPHPISIPYANAATEYVKTLACLEVNTDAAFRRAAMRLGLCSGTQERRRIEVPTQSPRLVRGFAAHAPPDAPQACRCVKLWQPGSPTCPLL